MSRGTPRWAHNPEVAGSNPVPATTEVQVKGRSSVRVSGLCVLRGRKVVADEITATGDADHSMDRCRFWPQLRLGRVVWAPDRRRDQQLPDSAMTLPKCYAREAPMIDKRGLPVRYRGGREPRAGCPALRPRCGRAGCSTQGAGVTRPAVRLHRRLAHGGTDLVVIAAESALSQVSGPLQEGGGDAAVAQAGSDSPGVVLRLLVADRPGRRGRPTWIVTGAMERW